MVLNLRQLLYLTTLAETGSYHKASQKLYISQPTLSISIKKLEDRLGFPLYERDNKQVVPTEAGAIIIAYAQKILALDGELENKLSELKKSSQKVLRVGTYQMLYSLLLTPLLNTIRQSGPAFSIKLQHAHNRELKESLRAGAFDLILCIQDEPEKNMETVLLKKERLLLALPDTHPACQRSLLLPREPYPYLPVRELENECFILQLPSQQIRWQEDKILHSGEIKKYTSIELDSIATSMRLVSEGAGIGFLMEPYTASFSHYRNLRFFLTGNLAEAPWLMVCYPKRSRKNPHILRIVRLLKKTIDDIL
jgi:DNA-binding transcriptional LysR family regulator